MPSVENDAARLKCECRGGPHGGYTCVACSPQRTRIIPPGDPAPCEHVLCPHPRLSLIYAEPNGRWACDLCEEVFTLRPVFAVPAENGLLDNYDPWPGLVARGVVSDEHDPDSCEAACCIPPERTDDGL